MSNFIKDKTYALFDSPLNKKLINQLATEAIETVVFPTITTKETSFEKSIFENLNQFDWLIFEDVYTVEYFVNTLEKLGLDLFEIDELRVLAFGESIADRLRFSQLHADVIPNTIKISDILKSLQEYIFDPTEFENLQFLILKETNSDNKLAQELIYLNSNVVEIPIYTVKIEDEEEIPKLKALLKGGAIDVFIFSSHYDVLSLAQLFPNENLSDLLNEITITSTDDLTLQSLQEFRLIEK